MRGQAGVNAAADPDTLGGQMEDKLPVIPCAPERRARRSDRHTNARKVADHAHAVGGIELGGTAGTPPDRQETSPIPS
jgi:hypothetical protein